MQNQLQLSNENLKLNKLLALILSVFLLSVTCSLAAVSGSHSFTNTYNSGEVCDVRGGYLFTELDPSSDDNYFWVSTLEKSFTWKYMYIDVDETDFDISQFRIETFKENKTTGHAINYNLKQGYNIIKFDGEDFDTVKCILLGDKSVKFKTNFIQFRENKYCFSGTDFLKFFGMFVCFFSLISLLIRAIYKHAKIDCYAPIDFLQDVYISFGNRFVNLSLKVPHKIKRCLRIIALLCWMFWIMFIYNMGKYMLTAYFKYNVLLFCITMLLIAVSMLEKPLEKRNWNKPLVYAWFWLSICMCISEFLISKRFCMIGYVNLFIFGFYYFVWDNLKDKNQVIREVITTFKIAFFISVVITLLCRPRDVTYGLIGHTWNPNIYGIFCAIALMSFLASLRLWIIKRKHKRTLIIDLTGILISGPFILLAGSRAGIILAIPGCIFFCIEYIGLIRRKCVKVSVGIMTIPMFLIAFYLSHMFLSWATVNLPIMQLVFPWDSTVPNEAAGNASAFAAEMPALQAIVYNPELTNFLSGRNLYWMEYLRDFNFFGHEYYPSMWGGARYPHNGILGIIYRYGVLAAVPYILMFVNAIIITFKAFIKNRYASEYAFYMWICVIGISLCMLVENFERPFLATEWLWWYWCLGYLFISNDSKKCEDITEV